MDNSHIRLIVTCAAPNCGKVRQEANHWFLLRSFGDDAFTVYPWSERILSTYSGDVLPLCGEACVIKMASVYMAKLKAATDTE